MTNDKGKTPPAKAQSAAGQSSDPAKSGNPPAQPGQPKTATPAPATIKPFPPLPHPAPLFRKIDWLTLLITFAAVWIGYYLTLAPELTLEDSGELATGSFYAGIPHPPGYPVWTIYTWLWTVLVPFKNVAWRVALGEATGGALAAGLLGLLVSRGSSLLMEGIEDLKTMTVKWESAICMVSGFVAGTLVGFNGFMWSQSVIVEVYAFSVASFMVVLLCLLRWIYAPHQRRDLYFALFFHGVCFTNHQTLIVAALGIEVAIAAANFRMGRSLFFGNSIIYLAGLILKQGHMLGTLEANPAVLRIFHVVGVCSILISAGFAFLTRQKFSEIYVNALEAALLLLVAGAIVLGQEWLPFLVVPAVAVFGALGFAGFAIMTRERFSELCRDFFMAAWILLFAGWVVAPEGSRFMLALLALGALGTFIYFAWITRKLGWEWLVVIICGLCWIIGALFYFYMPLAGMTNPPMEWGYPRTVEGFFHAFTRGQYEKANPTEIISWWAVPWFKWLGLSLPVLSGRFIMQLGMLGKGIIEEFNWVYTFLALVPFLFFRKLHRRERAWLIGITAIYFFLGILLLILLNPPPDRAAQDLVRVFFTASHTLIALLVGYGLTLVGAYMGTHYQTFRSWGLIGGAAAVALALFSFVTLTQETFFGQGSTLNLPALLTFVGQTFSNKNQYGLPVYG